MPPSTQPAGPANPVVSWSVAGSCVAICARDGLVKAWNFETGAVTAQFIERLTPPRKEGGIACGPNAAVIALVDPNESKSLRVLDAAGKRVAVFKDFPRTDELLPNGMIDRLIGFTPDGSALITAQNSDDYIGWFDLRAKRLVRVLELSKRLADMQWSVVVALRDASGFVHFHGAEAIEYDFQGHVHCGRRCRT